MTKHTEHYDAMDDSRQDEIFLFGIKLQNYMRTMNRKLNGIKPRWKAMEKETTCEVLG